jgi:hypothetical protein
LTEKNIAKNEKIIENAVSGKKNFFSFKIRLAEKKKLIVFQKNGRIKRSEKLKLIKKLVKRNS